MHRLKTAGWIASVLLMFTVQISAAGELTVTIEDDIEQSRSSLNSSITHFSGPLKYEGVRVGTGTAILFRGLLPGDGDLGAMGRYEIIEWDLGVIAVLLITEMAASDASGHPVTVINKETGEKIMTGTLEWGYSTDDVDLTLSW